MQRTILHIETIKCFSPLGANTNFGVLPDVSK